VLASLCFHEFCQHYFVFTAASFSLVFSGATDVACSTGSRVLKLAGFPAFLFLFLHSARLYDPFRQSFKKTNKQTKECCHHLNGSFLMVIRSCFFFYLFVLSSSLSFPFCVSVYVCFLPLFRYAVVNHIEKKILPLVRIQPVYPLSLWYCALARECEGREGSSLCFFSNHAEDGAVQKKRAKNRQNSNNEKQSKANATPALMRNNCSFDIIIIIDLQEKMRARSWC
jgi:hypothetical protein